MTAARHYSRPPLIEAIIDFQVDLPAGVGLTALERCQDGAYPEKRLLSITADHSASAPSGQAGFRFASADGKQLFEARLTGFTVRRLAPYQGWGPFREEARRLWGIYRQATAPRKVTRVAVRYLNRLDLPLPVAEVKDFLRTFPEVSSDLPQTLAGFGMELNIPLPDVESTLLLRERVVPPARPGVASVLLDIDLFRSDRIPPDDPGIWAYIEALRARKNAIFEACITDRVREVIA